LSASTNYSGILTAINEYFTAPKTTFEYAMVHLGGPINFIFTDSGRSAL
jgi:hypothetical protein